EDYRPPRGGELKHVWVCKLPLLGAGGEVEGVQGVFLDLKDSMEGIEPFRLASAVLEAAQQAVMITDLDGRILRVNPAFERITGYSAAEAIGETPRMLSSGQQSAEFYTRMWAALREHGHWQGELVNR